MSRFIMFLAAFIIAAPLFPQAMGKGKKMEIKIESSAFKEGELIPSKYTCGGENISPALKWSGVPAGARTLVLIADDPDAPAGTWVHWVVYNIPPDANGLKENIPHDKKFPDGMMQGTNDFGKTGYGGPCPPSGTHRYYFKLYAVDTLLKIEPGAFKKDILKMIDKHILAEGRLMGRYKRN